MHYGGGGAFETISYFNLFLQMAGVIDSMLDLTRPKKKCIR